MTTPEDAVEPVSVIQSGNAAPAFRLPAAPAGYGAARWIPPGESIQVGEALIPGGLLYVGTRLRAPSGHVEPALIDPSRPVASSADYSARQMGYWPSYSDISPAARRAYLNWLADGRRDPAADIGFVFLYFYGLERRVMVDSVQDAAARADWPCIAAELYRLLAIYGESSRSFRSYAGALLDWVTLAESPARLYAQPVPGLPRSAELPAYLRLALGQAAVDGVPVPAELALAWARLDPAISLRTPATRCRAEFDCLFLQQYEQQCGAGIQLKCNRTRLKLVYSPASLGLQGCRELKLAFADIPDVTAVTAPVRKLQEVVEASTGPLDSFSRQLGKNPDARSSLEALLLLPQAVWPDWAGQVLQQLKARIGSGMVVMTHRALLESFGVQAALSKDRMRALLELLESMGIGFEPDVLAGVKAPALDDKVVVFALPAQELAPRTSGPYLAALLTLQLASTVAIADGKFDVKELRHLLDTVNSWQHLSPAHNRRLLAQLRLLMMTPASLPSLRKKLDPLDAAVKETIAGCMAAVAQADGVVLPPEIRILEKIYKALGIDAGKVFSALHGAPAGGVPAANATSASADVGGLRLDPERIAALQKDTERVSALLANIFVDDEAVSIPEPTPAEVVEPEPSPADPELLPGLDEAHAALVRMLLSRPEWSRDELLDVAADLDLMLDGALEHINEAAFDAFDAPLLDGDDPVTVSTEILERFTA